VDILQVLLELSKTVENKGGLINCLRNVETKAWLERNLESRKYGATGIKTSKLQSGDGLSKFYD